MFDKLKQYVTQKKETTEADYDLTYDDVAIPEVHLPKSKITSSPLD